MIPSSSTPSRTLVSAGACFALSLVAVAAAMPAQSVVYTQRNGGDLAGCGQLVGGPAVWNQFLTPSPTNDSIAVSDPGGSGLPASAASAQLVANPTTAGISLQVAGSVMRTAPAGTSITAVADSRDVWQFTLTAPMRFTLNASLSTASTEATMPPSHFTFAGAIVPDPGSPAPPYQHTLQAPGSFSLTATGTLLPGNYFINLFGRAESMASPFSMSFTNSLTLTLQPAAQATSRQASGNPNSFTSGLPVLGQPWNAAVDVGTTGHTFSLVFASLSTAQIPVAPGFTVLLGGSIAEFLPIAPGPIAAYTFAMPGDPSLAGFQLFTQALHFGGASSFLLSNSRDLVLGF